MHADESCVLVTGANRGIGLGLVQGFLQKGCQVIATCRHPELAEDLQILKNNYSEMLTIARLDVTRVEDFQEVVSQYAHQRIDILMNNAGIFPEDHSRKGLASIDPQAVTAAFATNALGALLAIQHFLPWLLKSLNPRIINLSSQMGALSAAKGFGYAYRMSKVALNMLTKCFAEENPRIITIALRPGWVQTKMGGPNANLSIEDSVQKMLTLIAELTPADSGQFFDHEKKLCAW